MPNPEHLAIIQQGVGAWNKWRNNNLDIRPDLTSADLTGAKLSAATRTRADQMYLLFQEEVVGVADRGRPPGSGGPHGRTSPGSTSQG